MLNLNGSLTKAGVKYSSLWAEDFRDRQFTRRGRRDLLDDRDREELLEDGDGVTVGRLLELAAVHRDLISAGGRRG